MKIREARATVRRWVTEHAAATEGFAGAFFAGSTTWLPEEADLPATSDIDVMVVLNGRRTPPKLGKFRREGVLVEVTYLSWEAVASAERVLASYHLAASLRAPTVIADPTGRLTEVQVKTARDYARLPWVRARCEEAERRVRDGLQPADPGLPFHDQVTAWMFPASVTTHVLLTAGLLNPTVRLRYAAVRALLLAQGERDLYEELLGQLGCAQLGPDRVTAHLDALTKVFDMTVPLARTPFFFSSDITAEARPIAIDGSRELIARGLHREAVFWIAATYARCLTLLTNDAPWAAWAAAPGFARLLADLGITSSADIRQRAWQTLAFLPRLREVRDSVLAQHPDIKR